MLSSRALVGLRVQRAVAHVLFPLLGPLIVLAMWIWGYRIEKKAEIRRRFREMTRGYDGPLLICSNHMTKVDSAFIACAMSSNWSYMIRFHRFPWNIPEWKNFYQSLGLRLICYLAKCVPIVREGTTEQKRESLAKLEYVLGRGETVAIFPEGGRSRTGKLDMENFGYGTGQLWERVPGVRVICVYMRGYTQDSYTATPVRGERMFADIQQVDVQTEHSGRRAARDVTRQIMNALHELEGRYYAQLASTPDNSDEINECSDETEDRSA